MCVVCVHVPKVVKDSVVHIIGLPVGYRAITLVSNKILDF